MNDHNIFNRSLLLKRRNRIAAGWRRYDFLKDEAAKRIADCLADVTRAFPLALDIGCHKGELQALLDGSTVIRCDMAAAMQPDVVCDEEFLPFASHSFDLVAGALSLHHVNDLPGCLIQIREALKPDGLFIAAVPGVNTLTELRQSVTGASAKYGFALSPRVSPFVEVRDAGALLQRVGFALPVAHSETLTVTYDNALRLMQDLRGMGESNVLNGQRKHCTPRSQIAAICEYYDSHFANADGTVRATFEFIIMVGWKPCTLAEI
jgi:SAM-dependent methyltransferase